MHSTITYIHSFCHSASLLTLSFTYKSIKSTYTFLSYCFINFLQSENLLYTFSLVLSLTAPHKYTHTLFLILSIWQNHRRTISSILSSTPLSLHIHTFRGMWPSPRPSRARVTNKINIYMVKVERFAEVCRRRGLKVNADKTKVVVVNGEVGLECEFLWIGCDWTCVRI